MTSYTSCNNNHRFSSLLSYSYYYSSTDVTKVLKNHIRENCIIDNGVRRGRALGRPAPWSDLLPIIHVITPTYTRAVQKAELTRLTNTFLHVPNLHWIVVEDSPRRTPLVSRLLRSSGLNHTHLNVETPRVHRMRKEARGNRVPRGTVQRNLGLRWLRENLGRTPRHQGVVYFADDDNTYSLELFEEVRRTELPELQIYNILTSTWNCYLLRADTRIIGTLYEKDESIKKAILPHIYPRGTILNG